MASICLEVIKPRFSGLVANAEIAKCLSKRLSDSLTISNLKVSKCVAGTDGLAEANNYRSPAVVLVAKIEQGIFKNSA